MLLTNLHGDCNHALGRCGSHARRLNVRGCLFCCSWGTASSAEGLLRCATATGATHSSSAIRATALANHAAAIVACAVATLAARTTITITHASATDIPSATDIVAATATATLPTTDARAASLLH